MEQKLLERIVSHLLSDSTMEQKLLERILSRFATYIEHHPTSLADLALNELLTLSRDYLPEFTTINQFIETVGLNGTPNEYVNRALGHLLSDSTLFRIAAERVLSGADLVAEAHAAIGEQAEANAAAQDALVKQVEAGGCAPPVVTESAQPADSSDLFA